MENERSKDEVERRAQATLRRMLATAPARKLALKKPEKPEARGASQAKPRRKLPST